MNIIGSEQVQLVVVVTGCEQEGGGYQAWVRRNKSNIQWDYKMERIRAIVGATFMYPISLRTYNVETIEERIELSKKRVWSAVVANCGSKGTDTLRLGGGPKELARKMWNRLFRLLHENLYWANDTLADMFQSAVQGLGHQDALVAATNVEKEHSTMLGARLRSTTSFATDAFVGKLTDAGIPREQTRSLEREHNETIMAAAEQEVISAKITATTSQADQERRFAATANQLKGMSLWKGRYVTCNGVDSTTSGRRGNSTAIHRVQGLIAPRSLRKAFRRLYLVVCTCSIHSASSFSPTHNERCSDTVRHYR